MLRYLDKVSKKPARSVIITFLLIWMAVNIIQASFMELHPDEAYYWIYSRFLDWGYFDHPPMVALSIWLGDSIFPNKLGLRLITILTTTASVYLLWLLVSRYAQNAVLFILLFCSFLLFHVYGFITTPDSPLLLFSILFFYLYARYARQDSIKLALCLSVVIALLLYSKYHGILLLLFTILSNSKLLKRPSFWLIVVVSVLLYIPHIWWQVSHDYPSVQYHLFDRSARPYRINFTLDFIVGQILIAGPLVGWFLYWAAAKTKADDYLLKALKFNFAGIFIFFLLSTLKGSIEAHWTLLAFPPVFVLAYVYLSSRTVPGWFLKLAIANILLIVIARVVLLVPIPFLKDLKPLRGYFGTEEWAKQVHRQAGNHYVVFNQGFQEPSNYNFYNRTVKSLGYTSRYYRRNQFDYWPVEDSLRNKDVYFVMPHSHGADVAQDSFPTAKGTHYGRLLQNVRLYQKVAVGVEPVAAAWNPAEERILTLSIKNPYQEAINFSNQASGTWKCYLEYGFMLKGEIVEINLLENALEGVIVAPQQSGLVNVRVKAPAEPGEYKLFFSIRTDPFAGNRNSKMIKVNVQ